MKKVLALILVLCTLLCLFPVAVSANEDPELTPETEASYLDLYVKEGLVALYDGYSGVAGDAFAGTANWNAVDFYGKEGYDSYVALETSKANLYKGGSYLVWKWEDGYLAHTPNTNSPASAGVHRDEPYSYMGLEALGAELLADPEATLTVQQVFQLVGGPTQDPLYSTPVIEDGKVVNSASMPYNTYSAGFVLGDLSSSYCYYGWVYDGYRYLGGVWTTTFTGCTTLSAACYFIGDYYNVLDGAGLVDASGASCAGRWVRQGETGVIHETVTRSSSTAYNVSYRNALTRGDTKYSSFDGTLTATGATTLQLQKGTRSRIYSIRIYDTVLNEAQKNQNHLADLVGFYDFDADTILALTPEQFTDLINTVAPLSIAKDASEFDAGYAALAEAVDEVINREALEAAKAARLSLYVKEGLVALFDGFNTKAGSEDVTEWIPVDFYDAEGYDAYLSTDTTKATLSNGTYLAWRWADGYLSHYSTSNSPSTNYLYRDGNESFMNLDNLGAALMTSQDSAFTIQQVYQMAGGMTKDESLTTPVIEGNKVVNSETIAATYQFTLSGGFAIGDVKSAIDYFTKYTNFMGVYRAQYLDSADNKASYSDYSYFLSDYYNATEASDLVDANDASLEGNYVRRGAMGVITETVTRSSATAYKVNYNSPLLYGNMSYKFADYDLTVAAPTGSTSVQLLKGIRGRVYSVRAYNVELNEAQKNQNHFADLVNFYEFDAEVIDVLSLLTTEELTAMYEASASINIARELDTASMLEGMLELITLIMETMNVITEEAESIVSFGGVAYRTSGDYGVRALFSVDQDAIASLESRGYTVAAYGAIVGVGENGGNVVNESAEALTVKLDEETGKVVLDTGKGKIVSTDAESGFKHLTDDNVSFALSTTYAADGSNSQYYSTTLIYRAFTVITMEGEEGYDVLYDDVTLGETEDAISLVSVHEYALADTTGMTPELIERLEAVLPAEEE